MEMTKEMETYFANANFDIKEIAELINNSENLNEETCTRLMNQISPADFVKHLKCCFSFVTTRQNY